MMGYRELCERLSVLTGARTMILGVGNVLKGDDGVGPLVCEGLRGRVSAQVIDAGTVPENYIRPIVKASPQVLLVVDAIDFADVPGAVGIFTAEQVSNIAFSTHALSLRLFVDVLRADVALDVFLLGVQPVGTAFGRPVSAPVQESIETLVDALAAVFPRAGRRTTASSPGIFAR